MNADAIIRVLTVDDHPLMMAAIAGEINAQPDMRVVAEATDGAQGIAAFRELRPDVTLMDVRMPNLAENYYSTPSTTRNKPSETGVRISLISWYSRE
jgi:DNA-binding NarL/FixJ family response regulator